MDCMENNGLAAAVQCTATAIRLLFTFCFSLKPTATLSPLAAELWQQLQLGLPVGGSGGGSGSGSAAACLVASSTAEDGSLFVAGREGGAVKQVGWQAGRQGHRYLYSWVVGWVHAGFAPPQPTGLTAHTCASAALPLSSAAAPGALCAAGPAGAGGRGARRGAGTGCSHAFGKGAPATEGQ